MTPDQLKLFQNSLQVLKDSGMLDELGKAANEPGAQTAVVYGAVMVVAIFLFRVAVVDKIAGKVIQFHTDNLEYRKQISGQLEHVVNVFQENQQTSLKISETLLLLKEAEEKTRKKTEDVYRLIAGRRKGDQTLAD